MHGELPRDGRIARLMSGPASGKPSIIEVRLDPEAITTAPKLAQIRGKA